MVFAGFVNSSKVNEAKSYVEIRDTTKMKGIINQKLTEMNEAMIRRQNWTLVQESIVYLVRILRILQIEGGNGLIVGK